MLLTMSDKELNRVKIIQDTLDRRITREAAAKLLDISLRQVYRLILRFKQSGAEGLITLKRGKPSNHRKNESVRLAALNLIHAHYSDFGPTLAHEKLTERHGLTLGVETLRQWMIADGLWLPHSRRRPRIYQPRHRRDCLGELVQIDGSHHDWFEGRAEKCCLLVFIDDATGRLLQLHFCETESAFDYINATRNYVGTHGKPIAFYSDRHTVFHVSKPDSHTGRGTQFGRVLSDLNIELICANSSQAKGRVERANLTLQDRLVKELRLNGINSIEEANQFVHVFIEEFNRRFAKPANYPKDLHRTIQESCDELDDIFSWQEFRKVTKSLTIQYDKVVYLIDPTEQNTRLVGETVKVFDYPDGTIGVGYGHRRLSCRVFDKLSRIDQGKVVDNKRLSSVLKFAMEKQNELEKAGKRERSKKAPKRRAQQRQNRSNRMANPAVMTPLDTVKTNRVTDI